MLHCIHENVYALFNDDITIEYVQGNVHESMEETTEYWKVVANDGNYVSCCLSECHVLNDMDDFTVLESTVPIIYKDDEVPWSLEKAEWYAENGGGDY